MKRIILLIFFLAFGELLVAQQQTESCSIKVPAELKKEACGAQRIHLVFESSCSIQHVEITVYNRWGNILYVSDQLDHFWQGKDKTPGNYYYRITGVFLNGNKIDQNGYFTLL